MDVINALANPAMFPYHVALGVVIFYWGFVGLGMLDIEIFDLGGIDAAADGAMEGAAEGAMEGVAEGIAEGAAEGLTDGAIEGAAGSATGGSLEGATHFGFFQYLAGLLNLGQVPVSIIGSCIVLSMWFLAVFYRTYFSEMVVGLGFGALLGVALFIGQVVVSLYITGFATKPLRKYFVNITQHGRHHLVGSICTVRSGKVISNYGQAEVRAQGAPLLLSVRCDEENSMKRGDEAVIVNYDEGKNEYDIRAL